VYLRQFDTVSQARVGLKDYFEFYNYERLHQSLGFNTPAQVYLNNSSDNPVLYQPNSILIL
jgi:putative transposase